MAVDAVVVDWGGTLTPWRSFDLRDQWRHYAEAYDPERADELSALLLEARELRVGVLSNTWWLPNTKPHPEAFLAAMRAVVVPHRWIPADQRGHTEGEPDAVVTRLADLLDVVDRWRAAA